MNGVVESGNRLNITATSTAITGPGRLMGLFVSQASSTPTVEVEDGAGTIANTFTPLPGTYYPLPCAFNGTLKVTIGGTVDCTVFWVSG